MTHDSIEERARALALERFAGTWGNEFDPEDASDRAALEQLVQELLEKSAREASND